MAEHTVRSKRRPRKFGAYGPAARSAAERFWERVVKRGPDECWGWKGFVQINGYGTYKHKAFTTVAAHRIAYELTYGPVPRHLQMDHLCRNRGCVNPNHVEPVTQQENIRRGTGISVLNAAKTHCPKGHVYAGKNVRISPKGYRFCRECARVHSEEFRQKKRADTVQICNAQPPRAVQADDGNIPLAAVGQA
jgi:hypothetical protein